MCPMAGEGRRMHTHAAASVRGRLPRRSLTEGGVVDFPHAATAQRGRCVTREWTRKLWHMAPGGFALFVPLIPHRDPMSPIMRGIVLAVTLVTVTAFLMQTRRLMRPGERDFRGPVLGYALPVLFALLVFPAQIEIGLTVLAILAFGDGAAALAGTEIKSSPLPWNRQKSWAGTAAFVLAATPAAAWTWWFEANPELTLPTTFVLVLWASGLAAFAESIRSEINDNLRVGATSVFTLWSGNELIGMFG